MKRAISCVLAAVMGAALLVGGVSGTADAGKYWWVTARVHPNADLSADGVALLEVTYRCRLPHGNQGSTEVLSVLRQGPDRFNEFERMDVDEFWCDGRPQTVPQAYSSDLLPFRPGRAKVTLSIRVCTGDVTDDPGTCIERMVKAMVRLR